jgi:PEP-CTERM motif-containing protein
MRGLIRGALICAAAAGLSMDAADAGTYNLANEFSSAQGPVWFYGVYTAGGFVEFPNFTPATSSSGSGALEGWVNLQTEVLGTPGDSHNTSTGEWPCSCGTVVLLPGQAGFHPGPNGEIASYEFVAPVSGKYQLSSEFSGRDFTGPTDTQVSVVDGFGTTPIFTDVVDGYAGSSAIDGFGAIPAFGPSPDITFNDSLYLTKGDQLYFNVAFDPHGTRASGPWLYDSTAIAATLTVVPEPSTWALMALGFMGLCFAAHRTSHRERAWLECLTAAFRGPFWNETARPTRHKVNLRDFDRELWQWSSEQVT